MEIKTSTESLEEIFISSMYFILAQSELYIWHRFFFGAIFFTKCVMRRICAFTHLAQITHTGVCVETKIDVENNDLNFRNAHGMLGENSYFYFCKICMIEDVTCKWMAIEQRIN